MKTLAHRSRLLVAFFLLLPLPANVAAQEDTRPAKLDELLAHFEDHEKFMGTVAVSQAGRVVFQKQCGIRLPEASPDQEPNAETQYRVGSITKTFTAVMIMQLVEEGKLSLDTKLSEFYPEVTGAESISVRQLLGHRSGIGSFTSDPTYRDWEATQKSRTQMIEIIARQPKRFEPGEKQEYSNSNYALLGFIIERVTNSDYADELQSRICDRVGLTRTAYMTMADAQRNVARSFTRTEGRWEPHQQTHPSVPHGAGAIMSTTADLTRFAEALFRGQLVSEASLDEMTPDGLGMGFGLFRFGSKRALGHAGSIDGFQSMFGYFPDDKVAFAIIANGIDYRLNDITIGMLSIVFDESYELPEFADAQESQEEIK